MQKDPLSEAAHFLSSVLNRAQHKSPRSATLIGRLSTSLPDTLSVPEANCEREPVLKYATCLLQKIHTYFLTRNRPTPTQEDVFSPKDRRVITALLDLLALEGIYPCLAPGVGVPLERRAKAIIPSSQQHTGAIRKVRNVRILTEIVLLFTRILQGGQGEVFELLRDRCLVDVLAGCGELGFNPSEDDGLTPEEKETWKMRWGVVVEGIPTPQLLPVLMSLIHSQCPQWFLVPITSKLSTIPVHRPNAVRHILQMFLAAPDLTISDKQPSSIPEIPLDALAKAARLLGSVPRTVSSEKWFHIVGQQLLELVRDPRDEGLRRASSYVVAEFLAKKNIEKIIDREIVSPILKGLDPMETACANEGISKPEDIILPNIERTTGTSNVLLELGEEYNKSPPIIPLSESKLLMSVLADENPNMDSPHEELDFSRLVAETEILSTLQSLSFLLKSHPTPLAPEKLLKPILLPLWGLICFSRQNRKGPQWRDLPKALLVSYIKMVGASVTIHTTSLQEKGPIEIILYNLGYTGAETWEFGNGEYGGVEIRVRQGNSGNLNMEAIDMRVEEFMKLLQDVQIGEDGSLISALFLRILSDWLGTLGDQRPEDPVRVLARLKILQQILSNHTDKLGKKPAETLQVVHNIIGEYVVSRKALQEERMKQKNSTMSPSLNRLGRIIDPSSLSTPIKSKDFRRQGYIDGDEMGEDEQMDEAAALASNEELDSMERITITLSLLSSMIANPEVRFSEQEERLLQTLIPSLQFLSNAPPDLVNSSISSLASHISSYLPFITLNTLNIAHTASSPTEQTVVEQEKATYKTVMSYITDTLVPVRAHGIYLLRRLILARSPILDIPITLHLLLSMIKDTDSFVYLNVVKCLQSLSEKHPSTVVRLLVESYVDDSGKMTLDERLRVGEALLGTVQREGRMLMGEVAQAVVQGMIEVVSRRRRREDKSLQEGSGLGDEVKEIISALEVPEDRIAGKGENEEEEEEEELDESVNTLPSHTGRTQNLHLRTIKNWLPPLGTNLEDIRIRTSALSILSAAIDTNPLGIGAASGKVALDISLAILQLETTPEKDILRRAAMVCLAGLVKSHDQLGAGWVQGRLDKVKQVVEYIQIVDGDGLVREQGRQVAELIDEVWMEMMSERLDKGHHMFMAC